jgi:hypothetical protein
MGPLAFDNNTMQIRRIALGGALVLIVAGCSSDKCAGLSLSRLGESERTIGVGESFFAVYEEGGSCSSVFEPVSDRTRWTTAESTIVAVDSVTGQVTGLRFGDALVVPTTGVSAGPWSLLVHVRPVGNKAAIGRSSAAGSP